VIQKYKFTFTVICISIFLFGVVANYKTTKSFDAKVYSVNVQQKTHGDKDGFSTSYSYIVGTSRGTYSISPNGIFASKSFGALEKDSTYHFFTRGVSIPLIGVYPYIITAYPKEQ
jgi:hypothetical protein